MTTRLSATLAAITLAAFEAPQFQAEGSHVKLLATRTREAWMIARETYHLLTESESKSHAAKN